MNDRQTGGTFDRALALDVPGCGEKRDRDTKDMAFGAIVDDKLFHWALIRQAIAEDVGTAKNARYEK